MRRLTAASAALLTTVAVVVGGAAGTQAASAAAPVRSCSYDLDTAALVCVDPGEDLDAAVLAQAGLVVVTPEAGALAEPRASAAIGASAIGASAATTYVQSRLYDDVNYGGGVFQITGSGTCNGTTYSFGPLSSVGWAGRVSSFRSFSGCSTKIWQGSAYTGASYGYAVDAPSVGSMNDKANSVTMQ